MKSSSSSHDITSIPSRFSWDSCKSLKLLLLTNQILQFKESLVLLILDKLQGRENYE